MLCSRCATREAVLHFQQIQNNKITELRLCARCAETAGFSAPAPPQGLDFLIGLASSIGGNPPAPVPAACPACGLRYEEFQRSGRLGCADCYGAFEAALAGLIRKYHGSTRHSGKTPRARRAP